MYSYVFATEFIRAFTMNITKLMTMKSFLFSCDKTSFNQTPFEKHHSRTYFVASEFQKSWCMCRGKINRKREKEMPLARKISD